MSTLPRILFLHGSKGGPTDSTATYLSKHFLTHTPQMDTSSYTSSVTQQLSALKSFQPTVLVAESYGAAIAYELICRNAWEGPTLLMCPAVQRIRKREGLNDPIRFPTTLPLLVVHGKRDELIPIEDSKELVEGENREAARLKIVDDDHMMRGVVSGEPGLLKGFVEEVLEMGRRG